MTTTFQIIRGLSRENYTDFNDRIWSLARRISGRDDIAEVKFTVTEASPPTLSVIPFGKLKIAAIRTSWPTVPDRDLFRDEPGYDSGFVVEEAFPVAYERTWPLESRTPGVCLLTLFRQKKDLPYDQFIDRWHNGHTPLSLEIHPLWHYSRNVVKKPVGPVRNYYDGIVEEHCRTRKELTNPLIFFGGPGAMIRNMIRVYSDVRSFLDYSSIETYLVSEYYIKDISQNNSNS